VEKYPQRLPDIYRKVLDKQLKIASWALAYAIRASKLSLEKKLDLLEYGCRQDNQRHCAAALWQLKDLDRERFTKNAIKTLDALPVSTAEPCWECSESLFAVIVREADDPRLWQALSRAAKRAEVGLRMEYLGQVDATHGTAQQRRQRARFFAGFLGDDTVREGKARLYEAGRGADVGSYEIEVRNFAAIAIARQLELPNPYPGKTDDFHPAKSYLPEEWSELRERARLATTSSGL
jgi:uncharacterized protein YuzB (UPF0349 family)